MSHLRFNSKQINSISADWGLTITSDMQFSHDAHVNAFDLLSDFFSTTTTKACN